MIDSRSLLNPYSWLLHHGTVFRLKRLVPRSPERPLSRQHTCSCVVYSDPLDWLTWLLPTRGELMVRGIALVASVTAVSTPKLGGNFSFLPPLFVALKMKRPVGWISATGEPADHIGGKTNCAREC